MVVLLGESGRGLERGQADQLSNAVLQLEGVAGLSLWDDCIEEVLANDRKIVHELTECIWKHVPMKNWPEFVRRYYAALMDEALGFRDDKHDDESEDMANKKVCMTIRKHINWDEQPLGKLPDIELAKNLGVSGVAVGRARRRRNIPAFNSKGGACRPQGQRAGVDWDKQPLGKEMDIDIATRLGVDRSSVRSARKARGIEATAHPDRSRRIGRIKKKEPAKNNGEGLRVRTRGTIELNVDEPLPKGPHVHRCPTCREDKPCKDKSCKAILENEDGVPMIYTTCEKCVAELAKERNDGIVPISSQNSRFGPMGRFM